MTNLLTILKVKNPKLAEEIEWKLADHQAKVQAAQKYRQTLEQASNTDLGR